MRISYVRKCRWERAEDAREKAEEEEKVRLREAAREASMDASRAGAVQFALPAGAALSMEEKLASKRQIFAPREAFKCASCSSLSFCSR